MSRDDPRGRPPMSEEDALDAALAEAMPMIVFWHEAEQKFGIGAKEALQEYFTDDLWSLAVEYSEHEDVRNEIFRELKDHEIKELTE